MNLDTVYPEKTHLQAFIEEIKGKFSISNEEILDFFHNSSEKIDIINEENMKKEDEDSFISWGVSSTPEFNEIMGFKRRLGAQECKSAELISKKSNESFSFLKRT